MEERNQKIFIFKKLEGETFTSDIISAACLLTSVRRCLPSSHQEHSFYIISVKIWLSHAVTFYFLSPEPEAGKPALNSSGIQVDLNISHTLFFCYLNVSNKLPQLINLTRALSGASSIKNVANVSTPLTFTYNIFRDLFRSSRLMVLRIKIASNTLFLLC